MRQRHFWLAYATFLLVLNPAFAGTEQAGYSLEQAIDTALANNPELGIMQARIEQANAQLGESLASFYPQIKVSLSYQHSDNPAQAFAMIIAQRRLSFTGSDFNHPGGVDDYRPQVTASYSLFRGGQDYYRKQAAELGIETSELEKRRPAINWSITSQQRITASWRRWKHTRSVSDPLWQYKANSINHGFASMPAPY